MSDRFLHLVPRVFVFIAIATWLVTFTGFVRCLVPRPALMTTQTP